MPASDLQFQRNVFEDVAQIGAGPQALKEAAAHADAATMLDHRGHPAHQPIVESRKFVRGLVQLAKIDPRLQDWKIRPNTRSPKRQNLTEFHSRDSLNDLAGVAVKQSGSQYPNTIYAANSQKVVSAGFSDPITTGNSSMSASPLRSAKGSTSSHIAFWAVLALPCGMWKTACGGPHKQPALPRSPQKTTPAQTSTGKQPYGRE